MEKTVVLLGAGASVDAGLPTSYGLTEILVNRINHDSFHNSSDITAALNHAVGAIVAHDARHGHNPYGGLDVERVFSAIQMLAERESLEVSPFVAGWTDPAPAHHGKLPAFWGRQLVEYVGKGLTQRGSASTWGWEKEFSEGVRAVMGAGGDSSQSYRQLKDRILRELTQLLRPTNNAEFDYLAPLLNLPNAHIATLNYDLGIETVAQRAGIEVDRGISRWAGGYDWPSPTGHVPLLKLHGSIDWHYWEPFEEIDGGNEQAADPGSRNFPRPPGIRIESESPTNQFMTPQPVMIFGARQKLRADGPFLAMLYQFSRWLRDAEHLIIIGYSFRDEHINNILQEWLASFPASELTIIDPGFTLGYFRDLSHFGRTLLTRIRE